MFQWNPRWNRIKIVLLVSDVVHVFSKHLVALIVYIEQKVTIYFFMFSISSIDDSIFNKKTNISKTNHFNVVSWLLLTVIQTILGKYSIVVCQWNVNSKKVTKTWKCSYKIYILLVCCYNNFFCLIPIKK